MYSTLYSKKTQDLFWKKVIKQDNPDACWIWSAYCNHFGHGTFGYDRKSGLAHRFSYEIATNIKLNEGEIVRHKCNNAPCVNPRHLHIGTRMDNYLDTLKPVEDWIVIVNRKDVLPHPLSETEKLIKRFCDSYEELDDNSCWIWKMSLSHKGYGRIQINGKGTYAHRFAWILHNKEDISETIFVCHSCDNPKCVNPNHLWLGTPQQNMDDKCAKGRAYYHPKGKLNFKSRKHNDELYTEAFNMYKSGMTHLQISRKTGIDRKCLYDFFSGKIRKYLLDELSSSDTD